MSERDDLAASLRGTITQLERGRTRAMSEGRLSDALTIGGMRQSCRYALGVLTNYYHGQPPRRRVLKAGPAPLTGRQEALLNMALRDLTPMERKLAFLTIGHDVPTEAAAVALDLTPDEAKAVEDAMVDKLRAVKRNALAAGGEGSAE